MLTISSLALSVALLAAPATSWPSFNNGGSSQALAPELPTTWAPDQNIAWQVELPGYGQSSPIVWNKLAYVTAVDGKEKETLYVVAIDIESGQEVWRKQFASGAPQLSSDTVSRAAPTPCCDAAGLYLFFESGDLIALSHTGDVRWQRSLSKDYGVFKGNHGVGSSLAQTENAIFALVDHDGPSYLLAVNKANGENLWKADRETKVSWTSPVVAQLPDRACVIVSSNGTVDAYDATSGELLWNEKELSGNTIPSPSVHGDLVLIGANASRRSKDESAASQSNRAIRLSVVDGKIQKEAVWSAEKGVCNYASPVAHQDCVYYVNGVGVLFCLDLKTGKLNYSQRIGGPCWATPIAAGDRVYFFGKNGITKVVKAGAKYEDLATNTLWNEEAAPPLAEKSAEKPADGKPATEQPAGSPPPMRAGGPGGGGGYGTGEAPILYGVAATENSLLIRTGTRLYAVRTNKP